MTTLNIKQIEKKLHKTIRRNCISIGFDVAERYTGICILKVDNKDIIIDNLQVIETTDKEAIFRPGKPEDYISL